LNDGPNLALIFKSKDQVTTIFKNEKLKALGLKNLVKPESIRHIKLLKRQLSTTSKREDPLDARSVEEISENAFSAAEAVRIDLLKQQEQLKAKLRKRKQQRQANYTLNMSNTKLAADSSSTHAFSMRQEISGIWSEMECSSNNSLSSFINERH